MEINKTFKDKSCKIELSGRLDTITSPQLEEVVDALPDDVEELVLDLKELDYVSSAGLRVLLSAHRIMSCKGGMKVTHVNEIVREVLEVTGFTDILTIE